MTLTHEEEVALARALDNYLPELRYEAARMKVERERHELVELDKTLTGILERIRQPPPEGVFV